MQARKKLMDEMSSVDRRKHVYLELLNMEREDNGCVARYPCPQDTVIHSHE